jgi:carboxyl-terminal processing protease
MARPFRIACVPFIVLAVLLSGESCSLDLSRGYSEDPRVVFEYFCDLYEQEYALFEERGVDWPTAKATGQALVDSDTTDEELFEALASMLELLDDPHVTLSSPFRFMCSSARASERTYFKESVALSYLSGAASIDGGRVRYGRIAGQPSIAYLRIRSFATDGSSMMANHSAWAEETDAVFDSFSDAAGLIIDIRDNGGGLMQDVGWIAGRFTDSDRAYAMEREKTGPGSGDYGAPVEIVVPARTPAFPHVPIVVLVNGWTTSAAEFMALAFIYFRDARIVGQRSAGGFSFRTRHELPNGWVCTVSMQKVSTPEGVSYEGSGISPTEVPDSVGLDELSVSSGQDRQMERAIAALTGG